MAAKSLVMLGLSLQMLTSSVYAEIEVHIQPTSGLELRKVANDEIKGCWKDSGKCDLAMCFYISNHLMRITSGAFKGVPMALYHTNKIRDMHYLQVLGITLVRFKSVEIRIPKVNSFSIVFKTIKRKFKKQSFNSLFDLYFFLARSRLSSRIRVSSLTRKTKKQALTENEAVALYKMSSSLGNHPIKSRFPKAMRRFHLLCLGFIQTVLFNPHKTDSWPNTKPSYGSSRAKGKGFPASRRLQKYSSLNRTNHQRHTKEKHSKGQYWRYGNHDNRLPNQLNSFFCQDMRDGLILQCFGMCGPKCWCWNWICEDCCVHKGCFQHDACCQNFLTTYCLLPFLYGFDCSEGYGGYPRCLI